MIFYDFFNDFFVFMFSVFFLNLFSLFLLFSKEPKFLNIKYFLALLVISFSLVFLLLLLVTSNCDSQCILCVCLIFSRLSVAIFLVVFIIIMNVSSLVTVMSNE